MNDFEEMAKLMQFNSFGIG